MYNFSSLADTPTQEGARCNINLATKSNCRSHVTDEVNEQKLLLVDLQYISAFPMSSSSKHKQTASAEPHNLWITEVAVVLCLWRGWPLPASSIISGDYCAGKYC